MNIYCESAEITWTTLWMKLARDYETLPQALPLTLPQLQIEVEVVFTPPFLLMQMEKRIETPLKMKLKLKMMTR
jgi:hypothetical protein